MENSIVRWILFVLSTGAFLVAASFNAWVAWRKWDKGQHDGPSFAPIMFGLIGTFAVLAAPFGTLAERIRFAWIPLVLDCGTIPYLTYGLRYALKQRRR